eukprot:5020639-Prymnesium_polylepis.1
MGATPSMQRSFSRARAQHGRAVQSRRPPPASTQPRAARGMPRGRGGETHNRRRAASRRMGGGMGRAR